MNRQELLGLLEQLVLEWEAQRLAALPPKKLPYVPKVEKYGARMRRLARETKGLPSLNERLLARDHSKSIS